MTNSASSTDRARYACAFQSAQLLTPMKSANVLRPAGMPPGIQAPAQLNPFDPDTPYAKADILLISYGQYLGSRRTAPGFADQRDRARTTVIGDSGGYQFISGAHPFEGPATCDASLRWLEEHADVAMTLDIPSEAERRNEQFAERGSALKTTVENLRYFQDHQTGVTQFLNVLQGRTPEDADKWYAAVKPFQFGGWAFGGRLRLDMYELCRRIAVLIRDGRLGAAENWIHVLGTARLPMAVMLTALKRGLREALGEPTIEITFDTSTPSLMMSKYLGVVGADYSVPLEKADPAFRLRQAKLPSVSAYCGSDLAFPFDGSRIGQVLKLGDLCADVGDGQKQSAWDELSNAIVVNHNLDCMLAGIEQANRIADLQPAEQAHFMPEWLIQALIGIRRFAEARDFGARMHVLRTYREPLSWLSKVKADYADLSTRDYGAEEPDGYA